MIKAIATDENGRPHLFVGLSHAELDRLRAKGAEGCISIEGKSGWPADLVIMAGPTEAAIADALIGADLVGPETNVVIDPKLKS